MGENGNATTINWTSWGLVIFFILLFMIFRGFGGFGGFGPQQGWGNPGCGVVSNCQVEKQGIIDTARTQYLVEQTARATQDATAAGITALGNKIDGYAVQDLRDKLAEERNKNMMLQNRLYSDGQFNNLARQNESMYASLKQEIAALACETPKRPPYFAQGYTPGGYPIPPASAYNVGGCGGTN